MKTASAPGKLIMLGEHAVVFGQPALAIAIDLTTTVRMEESRRFTMNGESLDITQLSYVNTAISQYWGNQPLSLEISSEIPPSSGLGSSAAVTVATLAALHSMKSGLDAISIAKEGFEVESLVQGRASPIDTSTSTHGQGVFIDGSQGSDLLWEISKDVRRWFVHHCEVPEMNLVVGFTGRKGPTGKLVAKVKRYADRSGFAREIIEEIGALTLEGTNHLKRNERVELGHVMTKNHKLLSILGVSSPELDKLVKASLPYSYGAKLTGAGGGGSMIALTDEVDKVCEAIKKRGGTPYAIKTGVEGVRMER